MKKLLLAITIVLLHFCGSVTFALDPIGSTADKLKKGQFSIGGDYSLTDMDFTAKGISTLSLYDAASGSLITTISQKQRLSLDGVEIEKAYVNLGYGITGKLEAFVRLGATDAQWKDDSDKHFSIGLRTGATLYEKDALTLSAIAQYSWAKSKFASLPLATVVGGNSYATSMSGDLSMHEIQIALGPTYELSKGISFYGGGFYHFMDGEIDLKGSGFTSGIPKFGYNLDNTFEIDQISEFGTYIGTKINPKSDISFCIEYQQTASAHAIAMRLLWML